MTNSTDTFWEADGHSLQTYAWNIVTWGEDREAPPPLRGGNVAVAYLPGQIWQKKTPDSRTLSMGFWVNGSNEDGSVPTDGPQLAKFQQNFKMLRKLLFQPRRQFSLTKKFYLYGNPTLYTATAQVEYAGGLNVVMNGTSSGVFTIDLEMADPYFYSDPISLTIDPHNPQQDFEVLGDDRALKILTTINGATSHLRVTNATYGIFFDYTKPLSAGQIATVDNLNFLAKHNVGGTNDTTSTYVETSATDPFWFFLEPGTNTLTIEELDVPTQGVEWTNQATNPSFETAGTQQTVLQNYIANTDFAAADNVNTQAVWKKNLFLNPNFTSATTGSSALLSAVLTRSTTQGKFASTSLSVATNGASGSGVGFPVTYDIAVANNPFLYCGAWVKAPVGFGFTVNVTNSGAMSPQVYTGTGDWQWVQTDSSSVRATFTVQPVFSIVQTSAGAGATFYVDGVTIQREPIDEAFYGGLASNHDGNGFSYSWSGTADNSQSLKQAGLAELYRNLAPNPMFANDVSPASASQTSIYTNLLQNPDMEASAGVSGQVRTNLITNPRASTTTGWSAVCGASSMTMSVSASGGPSAGIAAYNAPAGYLAATLASYPANTPVTISPTASANVAVSAGLKYVFSCWAQTSSTVLRAAGGSDSLLSVYIDWYNASSGLIVSNNSNYLLTVSSGFAAWQRIGVIGTAPVGAVSAKLRVVWNSSTSYSVDANATFWVTGALMEQAQVLAPYFDGAVATASPFTRAWTGTANASTSTETSSAIFLRRNVMPNPAFLAAGSSVMYPTSSATSSTSLPAGGPLTAGAVQTLTAAQQFSIYESVSGILGGETYTVSCYVYSSRALSFRIFCSSLVGSAYPSPSPVAVAANTWTRLTFTFAVPLFGCSTEGYATLSSSTAGVIGDSVYTTAWQLERGSNATPFFYGSTAASGDTSYIYTGTAALFPSHEQVSVAAPVVQGITPVQPLTIANGVPYRSTSNKTSNASSLAVSGIGLGTSDTYASLPTTGMVSGSTYTVIGKCIIPATGGPLGSAGPRSLQIAPSSLSSYTIQSTVPNAPGTYTFKATFTWDGSYLRAYNGFDQGTVYWDEVSIIPVADTDHPYPFDQPFYGNGRISLPAAMSGSSATYKDFYDGFAWTGTANSSTSTFYALQPFGTNPATNCLGVTSRFNVTSSFGVSLDATGLRIIPTSLSNNNSYVSPGGDAGALRLSLAAGKTYYISGYVTGTLTGSQNANAKRMVLLYKDSGGIVRTVTDLADSDPNHRYIIASIPAGTTEAYVRLYNGALAGGGDAIWTQFGVRQIDPAQATMTSFPAMASGDDVSGLNPRIVLRWTGTRWASPTTVSAPRPFKAGASTQYASLAPDPYLTFSSVAGSAPQMTIDGSAPYEGRCVAISVESGLLNSTTYTLRGKVTVPSASTTSNATDNRASVVWSIGSVTVVSESTVPNAPGTYDYTLVFTTPASGALSELDLYFSQGSTKEMSYWSKLMLLTGNAPAQAYFDGATSPDTDLTASWATTANQSSAYLKGTTPKNNVMTNGAAVQSTKWAVNAARSVRLIPSSSSNATALMIASVSGAYMGQLVEGNTYTLLATRHLDAPLTGTLSAYAGTAALVTANLGTIYSDQVLPNAAGTAELRWTFTVPVGAGSSTTLRLGHGGSINSGDVYWDQVLILQQVSASPYVGGFFDGDTPDSELANYGWSGTANDSTSVIRGVGSLQPIVISYQAPWI